MRLGSGKVRVTDVYLILFRLRQSYSDFLRLHWDTHL